MAYIGVQPTAGQYRKLDNISASFNGSTASFTTSVGGTNVTAGTAQQLIVSLGGVIQQPDTDYTVSTSTITFTTAPAAGLDFFAILMGDALNTVTPSDGSVTTSKLAGSLSVGLTTGSASTPALFFTGDTNNGIFSPSTDAIAVTTAGSERLRVTSAGLVGIGTSSPSSTAGGLDISSGGIGLVVGADGSVSTRTNSTDKIYRLGSYHYTNAEEPVCIAFGQNLSSDNELNFGGGTAALNAATYIRFFTAANNTTTSGTERMRITSAGNVGIGTNPVYKLDVYEASASGVDFRLRNTEGEFMIRVNDDAAIQQANTLIFRNSAEIERARIDSSGRLLVGTSTSTNNLRLDEKLAVVSTGSGNYGGATFTNYGGTSALTAPILDFQRSRGTTDGSMTAVASGDTLGYMVFRGSDGTGFVNGAYITAEVDGSVSTNIIPGRLTFSTVNTGGTTAERVRLDNVGNFFVYSSGNDTVVAGNAAGSGTAQSLFTGVHTRTSTTGGGTVAYRIYNNGTTFSVSDARQKKNVETARDGYLEDLQQLRVVKYNWIDQADTESKELGLIAQEVAEVFPGLVQSADPSDPESTLGIKSSVFSFMLIKALQEAGEKIEALEARLSALESA